MSDQPTDSLPKGMGLTPFDPSFRDQPYEVLKSLRERAPVLHDDLFNRWYLTRFDDVRQILRDKDMSSDPRSQSESYIRKLRRWRADSANSTPCRCVHGRSDNRRVRGLRNKALPSGVEALRRAAELATGCSQRSRKRVRVDDSFAAVLPVIVIAEMLGIDPDDRSSARSEVSGAQSHSSHAQQSEAACSAAGANTISAKIELRRAAPPTT